MPDKDSEKQVEEACGKVDRDMRGLEKEFIKNMVAHGGNESLALAEMQKHGKITTADIRDRDTRALDSECWQSEMPTYHRDKIAEEEKERTVAFLAKYRECSDPLKLDKIMSDSPNEIRRDLDHLSPAFMRAKHEEADTEKKKHRNYYEYKNKELAEAHRVIAEASESRRSDAPTYRISDPSDAMELAIYLDAKKHGWSNEAFEDATRRFRK
jgi:hypothetical protein